MLRRSLCALCTPMLVGGCGKPDPLAPYRAELEAVEVTDRAVLELSRREDLMAVAGESFRSLCVSCHGVTGSGLIGPSLTDDVYLEIRRPEDFFSVITYGRHARGMPEWGTKIDRSERLILAAYAASLRGTDDTGRKPEGEAIAPWGSFLSE